MRPKKFYCADLMSPRTAACQQRLATWRALVLLAVMLPALALAQVSVDMVSSGDPGDSGNGESPTLQIGPKRSISDDGRYAIYVSLATNLVDGVVDHNGASDVFLFDRVLGSTQLVSHSADSLLTAATRESRPGAISGDGRWVAYSSFATDLVSGVSDDNDKADAFLYDRIDGATVLVSHAAASATTSANDFSYPIALSADGRWLLYYSQASNLVPGVTDTNSDIDMFLYDRMSGNSTLVSHTANSALVAAGCSHQNADLSADGRWVAFTTTSASIVPNVIDSNNASDSFLFDRDTGTNRLVTHSANSPTTTGNFGGRAVDLSPDGRWVLYGSSSTNLVAGQAEGNTSNDVFIYDRDRGESTLVSRSAGSSTLTGNKRSDAISISSDGRWSLYYTQANNVMAGATGTGFENAYLFDRNTGLATLVSFSGAPTHTVGIGLDKRLSLSSDGRFVLWNTNGSVVGGITHQSSGDNVYLFDRQSDSNALISSSASIPMSTGSAESLPIGISADGGAILFFSDARDLVSGIADSNGSKDVFLRDRVSGSTQLVSRVADSRRTTANDRPEAKDLSADGRFVLINSWATNVVAGQIDSPYISNDVFLHDTVNDQNLLISRSTAGASITANGQSDAIALSADGRWALFATVATDIVSGVIDNNNGAADLYLYDRSSAQSTLISHAADSPLAAANRGATGRAMSADGRWLLYDSEATDVIPGMSDTLNSSDVFLVDRVSGARTLVSHLAGSPLTTADGDSVAIDMSADGRFVLYRSDATHIIPGQVGSGAFLYDRDTGLTVLASRIAGSLLTGMGDLGVVLLSADGQTVVYSSRSVDASSGISDTNGDNDVFRFDARTGTVTIVSRSAVVPNSTANNQSEPKAISADGKRVLYESYATDLISGISVSGGVYVYDHASGQTLPISHAPGSPTAPANGYSRPSDISADGNRVLFYTRATDLLPGISDNNGANDVYVRELDSGNLMLISRTATSATTTGSLESNVGWFSADGNTALFMSYAADLDASITDGNQNEDLYLATLPREAAMFADGFE